MSTIWKPSVSLLLCLSLSAGAVALGVPASPARPNVLFIAIDDLKPKLGCYGDTVIQTPHIDRLAAAGTLFTNNHCQQAICGPSRTSLLTGLRPDLTRVWDLQTRMRDQHPDILTLPQYFRQQGYVTAALGKIFDGRTSDGWHTQDEASWSIPYITTGGRDYAEAAEAQDRARDKQGQPEQPLPSTEAGHAPDHGYRDVHTSRRAVEELQRLAGDGQPFFLAVGFDRPHLPFSAPKRFWNLYRRDQFMLPSFRQLPAGAPGIAFQNSWELRNQYTDVPLSGPIPEEKQLELIHGYHASVSFVDDQVGRLLDALVQFGLRQNTIVILWGDHGYHLGDHGMFCKHTNYEQSTHTPLILSIPENNTVRRVQSPTELVDIFPTLCEAAGLPVPAHLHGQSLLPLARGDRAAIKSIAISQYPRRDPQGKALMGYAYRSDRYRYVQWLEVRAEAGEAGGPPVAHELYDYEKDPEETVNIVDLPDSAPIIAWFKEQLAGRSPGGLTPGDQRVN
jgi:iduronate 2-sulfatase